MTDDAIESHRSVGCFPYGDELALWTTREADFTTLDFSNGFSPQHPVVVFTKNLPAIAQAILSFHAALLCDDLETQDDPVLARYPSGTNRQCSICERFFPARRTFFHLRNSTSGLLDHRCKRCKHRVRVQYRGAASHILAPSLS